ncbi:hypothetical protein GCM10011575_43160 [Microlunatus endophyticus]|uniref:DNA-binding transcriptional regulator GbsR, MarR family n=1 Tax=Microlunatus endophyticus TaxID=1716077 RepID=A0A917SHP4_9ACTN|nr:transcriptional regulator [Microlunatus endophyticus]GGL80252.1 hypothetical protein GCM10011575_43160 [Microlunatus endophyticus]
MATARDDGDPGPSDVRQPVNGRGSAGLSAERREFIEDFATFWHGSGSPLMDGRVLAYLMILPAPYASSAQIAEDLHASSGSVSMSTRRLLDEGFIKRYVAPGERRYYFRTEADIWGSWLAGEPRYLGRQRDVMERALAVVGKSDDPQDAGVVKKLENGRDYMIWLAEYHQTMRQAWETYKAVRDARQSKAQDNARDDSQNGEM